MSLLGKKEKIIIKQLEKLNETLIKEKKEVEENLYTVQGELNISKQKYRKISEENRYLKTDVLDLSNSNDAKDASLKESFAVTKALESKIEALSEELDAYKKIEEEKRLAEIESEKIKNAYPVKQFNESESVTFEYTDSECNKTTIKQIPDDKVLNLVHKDISVNFDEIKGYQVYCLEQSNIYADKDPKYVYFYAKPEVMEHNTSDENSKVFGEFLSHECFIDALSGISREDLSKKHPNIMVHSSISSRVMPKIYIPSKVSNNYKKINYVMMGVSSMDPHTPRFRFIEDSALLEEIKLLKRAEDLFVKNPRLDEIYTCQDTPNQTQLCLEFNRLGSDMLQDPTLNVKKGL